MFIYKRKVAGFEMVAPYEWHEVACGATSGALLHHATLMRRLTTPEGKRLINSEIGTHGDSHMVTKLVTTKYVGGGRQ